MAVEVHGWWIYVGRHMREAWRELMYADTDQQAKATRDPVVPATRSTAARPRGDGVYDFRQ